MFKKNTSKHNVTVYYNSPSKSAKKETNTTRETITNNESTLKDPPLILTSNI